MNKEKDPAVLFFIKDWLVATKEMKGDERGWYLNLILHQYDKKDLPSDIEELANLADVRISEYDKFKQVFEQSLTKKFILNEKGRLENSNAKTILQGRENFKEKRSESGKMSWFIKQIRKNFTKDENLIFYIKNNVDLSKIDVKNQTQIKQVFKQISELYNANGNENSNINFKKALLFKESEYYDKEKFQKAIYEDERYANAHIDYYHEALTIWSDKGNRTLNWIAMAKSFMLSDITEGKFIDKDFKGKPGYGKKSNYNTPEELKRSEDYWNS